MSEHQHENQYNEQGNPTASRIKNLTINVGVSLATIGMLLLCSETGLRIYARARSSDVCGVNNFNATMLNSFLKFSDDPNLGAELKPNMGESATFADGKSQILIRTNSEGLRGSMDYSPEKPPGTYRIAIVGDSVTFGWGMKEGFYYPAILEKLLQREVGNQVRIEVMNFGVPGYNGDQKIITLRNKVLHYRPDAVIMGWLIDDLGHPSYLFGVPFLPNSATKFLNGHSYVFGCFRQKILNRWYQLNAIPYKEQYQAAGKKKTEEMFGKIADISRKNNLKILVAILPVWQTIEKNRADGIIDIHALIAKASADNGLDTVDVLSYIHGEDSLYFALNKTDIYHPNLGGHTLIANVLAEALSYFKFIQSALPNVHVQEIRIQSFSPKTMDLLNNT